jgi:hypothetical protein
MKTVTLDIPDNLIEAVNDIGDHLPVVLEMGMSRFAPLSTQAYREAISFLTQELLPEEIASFRFSDEIENRINELLDKNSANQLSQAEEVELERLSQLEEQLQLVKANALVNASVQSPPR